MFATTNAYQKIILEDLPLIDVRAPIEFQKGAIPNAVNLPIMNDEERHLVGICYKEKGNDKAVKLGHQLVSGEIKEARVTAWTSFLDAHPNAFVYCFRGGQRSQITQSWIYEAINKEVPRLEGGFKAFRNELITLLEPANQITRPIVLSGCTGSGKTQLLKMIPSAIDLEGLANHRGSTFGGHLTPQPTQINFENALAYAIVKHQAAGHRYLLLEDEGKNVGKCFIPNPLVAHFGQGDMVILETSLEERVENTLQEYVVLAQKEYTALYGTELGLSNWLTTLQERLSHLENRLGRERCTRIQKQLTLAYGEQLKSGSLEPHRVWIEPLLHEYYDPMYLYQMENSSRKVLFRGDFASVKDYLLQLT